MRKAISPTRLLPLAALAMAAAGQAQDRSSAGWQIMTDAAKGNCVACHALPGLPGLQSSFAPSLDKVGSRYDAAQLLQWVSDARRLKADTLMPPFGSTEGLFEPSPAAVVLNPEQIRQVVATLQSLQ